MSQIELSLFRNNEGREIEIDIIVDYEYQEYEQNPYGSDQEEGLIINKITDLEDEIIMVTDYERSEIEEQILECLREPSEMMNKIDH